MVSNVCHRIASPTLNANRPFAQRDLDGRIVAVQLAWQKFVLSRSPFHIQIRIWRVKDPLRSEI